MRMPERAQETPYGGGLDAHLARLLGRLAGREDPLLDPSVRLVCRLTGQGHICANLAELAGKPLAEPGEDQPMIAPPLAEWCDALRQSPVVGRPREYAPLVLDEAGALKHLAQCLVDTFVYGSQRGDVGCPLIWQHILSQHPISVDISHLVTAETLHAAAPTCNFKPASRAT